MLSRRPPGGSRSCLVQRCCIATLSQRDGLWSRANGIVGAVSKSAPAVGAVRTGPTLAVWRHAGYLIVLPRRQMRPSQRSSGSPAVPVVHSATSCEWLGYPPRSIFSVSAPVVSGPPLLSPKVRIAPHAKGEGISPRQLMAVVGQPGGAPPIGQNRPCRATDASQGGWHGGLRSPGDRLAAASAASVPAVPVGSVQWTSPRQVIRSSSLTGLPGLLDERFLRSPVIYGGWLSPAGRIYSPKRSALFRCC